MTGPSPLQAGETLVVAQMSPCVGGLVRTWADGGQSQLWRTPDAEWLLHAQGTGQIGRSPRGDRRFREVGMLSERSRTLLLQSRFPTKTEGNTHTLSAHLVRLHPAATPTPTVLDDFRTLLSQAVHQCAANDEFLVIEKGGWGAPFEPFCLFIITKDEASGGLVSMVETAPAPVGSRIWQPRIDPDSDSQVLSAPATPESINVVPLIMIDAVRSWGLQPWDLALTFGRR